MSPITEEQVKEALNRVIDPGRGDNSVVNAGMIHGLVVRDGHVGFSIVVSPEEGPQKEPLRKECEDTIRALDGVLSVTAVLTAHSEPPAPNTSAPNPNDAGRTPAPKQRPPSPQQKSIPGVKKIIAVASGKGGVGKSTMAVNLALALSAQGKKIGLLDADIYGPSIPSMLGLSGKPESPDGKKLLPMEKFGLKTMSMGYIVDPDTAMIWRGPMVMKALTQMMMDVLWDDLDILVVDMPPGTGDAQLTLVQTVPLAGALIVSTPQEVALVDVRRSIKMFERTGVPILGIAENMAYFVAPGSSEKTFIFGEGGAKRMAEELDYPFLGEIPIDPTIAQTSDSGEPLMATDPDSDAVRPIAEIAAKIAASLDTT